MHEPCNAHESVRPKTQVRNHAPDGSEGKLPEPEPAADVRAHGAGDEDGIEGSPARLTQERHEEDEDECADDGPEVVGGVDWERTVHGAIVRSPAYLRAWQKRHHS